jgi:hypothetical protein
MLAPIDHQPRARLPSLTVQPPIRKTSLTVRNGKAQPTRSVCALMASRPVTDMRFIGMRVD